MDQPSAHILFLDLGTGQSRREPLSPARRYADGGGRSLAGACFLAAQPDGAAGRFDAPATPVCLFPGGLAGYGLPGASFATLLGRSPHTGGVLTAAVPGGLGHGLARAGLAGLVLTGRAGEPGILVIDAQYTPREKARHRSWGHGTWREAAAIAREAQVGELILTHHDRYRTDAQLDAIVRKARRLFPRTRAARDGMTPEL